MRTAEGQLVKRATGLAGLDAVTHGGLPAGGATLVLGEPGSGKTVLGLNLVACALERGEAALFVSFEESREQVLRDAASFRWGADLAASERWRLVDARPDPDTQAAGSFDLEGLLAGIGSYCEALGATWIVIDGIDRLLRLDPDARSAVNHVSRLNDWCREQGITLLLTGKRIDRDSSQPAYLEGIEFMLDTVLVLATELVHRRLNRRFRIAKYRGNAHTTDELAVVIDDDGFQVPYDDVPPAEVAAASSERVSTGVARLDKVLGGGPYRGSTVLISGQPGTAKTTLAVGFARAAAERGERALYVSFDEFSDRIVRNVASVGIDLQPAIDAGHLHIRTREAWRALIEEHYLRIQALIDELQPDCLVLDPVSALLKANSAETAFVTTERLIGQAAARGITTVLTSLVGREDPTAEGTLSHVSTLADTWITLAYHVRGGERNRSLSVVKSRGSAHSNQVRELLLSGEGVDLADIYQYGSEVLMGTARLQKESEQAADNQQQRAERLRRKRQLERELEQARMRSAEAESETERLADELERERQAEVDADHEAAAHRDAVMQRRDPARKPGDRTDDDVPGAQ